MIFILNAFSAKGPATRPVSAPHGYQSPASQPSTLPNVQTPAATAGNTTVSNTTSTGNTPPAGTNIIVKNACLVDLWPAFAALKPAPFKLGPGEQKVIPLPNGVPGGRVWGKTGCNTQGTNCAIGDGPVNTLYEFATDKDGTYWYDISLVDGFSAIGIKTSILGTPSGPTNGNKYRCGFPSCLPSTSFGKCPSSVQNSKDGKPASCRNTAGSNSPTSQIFKSICPDAYSFPADDATSMYQCTGTVSYVVEFQGC